MAVMGEDYRCCLNGNKNENSSVIDLYFMSDGVCWPQNSKNKGLTPAWQITGEKSNFAEMTVNWQNAPE